MIYHQLRSFFHAAGNAKEQWLLKLPSSCEERWPLDEGQLVTNWNPDLFVAFLQEGPHLDFPCVIGNWHLMSALMREVLEQAAPDSIQFLPIRIRSPHGEVIDEPYFVANYLRLLDVVDREYSRVLDDEWSLDETGEFTNVEYAVLNRAMIGDASVFRVLGQPELVVYREDVVGQMRDRELTGCVFSPVPCSD